MFGKPQWFKPKTWGWGVHPVTWQGWAWVAGWLGVMLVPYVSFLSNHMFVEGFIWLGAMLTVMIGDVWQILRGMRPPTPRPIPVPKQSPTPHQPAANKMPDDGILFLGETHNRPVGTKNYDFRVRQ